MPSRQPPPPPLPLPFPATTPPSPTNHNDNHVRIIIPIVAGTVAFSLLAFTVFLLFRKLSRHRSATAPSDNLLKPPHRFSYSTLRRATSSFSASNRLGQGGFGSVYKATLPSGVEAAVKVMDVGSLQGEREFNNELSLASKIDSNYVVSILGFSSDDKRRRMVLVYELMENGSLQDALLSRKCAELMQWKARFSIANDIANGLMYLHNMCDPPVIHGDIKPSNVLLDCDFKAKIADFGLARMKIEGEDDCCVEVAEEEDTETSSATKKKKMKNTKKKKKMKEIADDNGSIIEEEEEETESVVTTGFEIGGGVDLSPESCVIRALDSEASPEVELGLVEPSPSEGLDKTSLSEACFDKLSIDSGKDFNGGGGRKVGRKNSSSRRDWWWKQDNGGGSESGRVKDYVMEWIGNEIKKERPKTEWIGSQGSLETSGSSTKMDTKRQRKRLEWWASLDEEKIRRKEKNRKPREWWKEEFCEELSRKNKKRRGLKSNSFSNAGESWWQKDEEEMEAKRKKRKSRSSIDWWLDGLSGELRNGRRNGQDWASGDIPKSGGISSTPSMRGTVCYIAPEYGGGGQLSEKCDVYSFGVLLLVLISGRRPLQVTASPMSEFERANLISWARQLAHNGKLLDLVDPIIQSLDRQQALLCITIALLCLQRLPTKRPSMKEIVGMLSGESEPPHLPFEFSPSPPSNLGFKSRKKAR